MSSINKHFLSTEIKFKTYHKTTHHCKYILPWSLYGILHSFENNPLRFQIDAFLHKPKTNKWDISNKALNNKLYSIGTGKIFINIINIPMIAFLKCHLFAHQTIFGFLLCQQSVQGCQWLTSLKLSKAERMISCPPLTRHTAANSSNTSAFVLAKSSIKH